MKRIAPSIVISEGERRIRERFFGHASLCNRFSDSRVTRKGKWIPRYNALRECSCYLAQDNRTATNEEPF